MSLILGSERTLFDRYIVKAELNVDDFEITKERDVPGITKLIGTGKVTVIYKPTGIARHYRDGVYPPPHAPVRRNSPPCRLSRAERIQWAHVRQHAVPTVRRLPIPDEVFGMHR